MDLTSSATVLPRILPSVTNLAPFLYESKGGRHKKETRRKIRKNKKRDTRRKMKRSRRDSRKK